MTNDNKRQLIIINFITILVLEGKQVIQILFFCFFLKILIEASEFLGMTRNVVCTIELTFGIKRGVHLHRSLTIYDKHLTDLIVFSVLDWKELETEANAESFQMQIKFISF